MPLSFETIIFFWDKPGLHRTLSTPLLWHDSKPKIRRFETDDVPKPRQSVYDQGKRRRIIQRPSGKQVHKERRCCLGNIHTNDFCGLRERKGADVPSSHEPTCYSTRNGAHRPWVFSSVTLLPFSFSLPLSPFCNLPTKSLKQIFWLSTCEIAPLAFTLPISLSSLCLSSHISHVRVQQLMFQV